MLRKRLVKKKKKAVDWYLFLFFRIFPFWSIYKYQKLSFTCTNKTYLVLLDYFFFYQCIMSIHENSTTAYAWNLAWLDNSGAMKSSPLCSHRCLKAQLEIHEVTYWWNIMTRGRFEGQIAASTRPICFPLKYLWHSRRHCWAVTKRELIRGLETDKDYHRSKM